MGHIDRDGVRIHFTDTGSGPCLILGHSFLCSGEMWAPQVPALAEFWRVINVDLRGHGGSAPAVDRFTLYDMMDDLAAVLDRLEIEHAVWGGLSTGGMIALRAALRMPERVRALMLLDTHAGAEPAAVRVKYGAMALGTRLLGLGPFLPAIDKIMFGATTRRRNPTLVEAWRRRFAATHVPSMLAFLSALKDRDSVVGRLGEIEVPALVLVGEEDAALPPAYAMEMAVGLPNATHVVVPEAGHLSTLEQPDAVTRAMMAFLEKL